MVVMVWREEQGTRNPLGAQAHLLAFLLTGCRASLEGDIAKGFVRV